MPDMPTITVTTEQQTRILAAYKDSFGTTTNAETIAAYKKMLVDMVKGQVMSFESRKLYESLEAQKKACEAEVTQSLSGIG